MCIIRHPLRDPCSQYCWPKEALRTQRRVDPRPAAVIDTSVAKLRITSWRASKYCETSTVETYYLIKSINMKTTFKDDELPTHEGQWAKQQTRNGVKSLSLTQNEVSPRVKHSGQVWNQDHFDSHVQFSKGWSPWKELDPSNAQCGPF